ncbi:MAG: hypothetical protein RIR01_193 [Bacteroidota bacterium]|jgi:hypothetical protein
MKFRIKSEFLECDIITKDKSGNDVLVNKNNFNDYFANLMFLAGQSHLIEQNPHHNIEFEEKKTFEQLSENVIALTYNPLQIEESNSKEIQQEQELKRKRGRQPKAKE